MALLLYFPLDGLQSLYLVSALFRLFQGGMVLTATLLGIAQGGWISGQMFDLTSSCRAAYVNSVLWNLMNLSIVLWLQGRLRGQTVAT